MPNRLKFNLRWNYGISHFSLDIETEWNSQYWLWMVDDKVRYQVSSNKTNKKNLSIHLLYIYKKNVYKIILIFLIKKSKLYQNFKEKRSIFNVLFFSIFYPPIANRPLTQVDSATHHGRDFSTKTALNSHTLFPSPPKSNPISFLMSNISNYYNS